MLEFFGSKCFLKETEKLLKDTIMLEHNIWQIDHTKKVLQ